MKIFKEIFGRIWAVWGILTFIISFLIIFIPSMLTWLMPEPFGQHVFIIISRIWMRVWLTIAGCPFFVKGKSNFQKGKTYIVTFNHNSLLDVPLSCPFVPGPNKTIAKSSFTKVPLFGFFYMKGSVIVDRNSEKSRKQSFEKMKQVLANKMHMCIYPEGTRNRTSEPLKKFHDGAFKLAEVTGHDIIPAVIFNTKKALPASKPFFFLPAILKLHFLEPVTVTGLSAEQIKQKVFSRMYDHYVANSSK
jgi:1-acyl-sn-glycerol-3-phosphate acyltransferase